MADFYGINFDKRRANPPKLVDGGQYGGRVRPLVDQFTVAGTVTTNDKIFVGRVPAGATFVGARIGMGGTSAGSGRTLALGDAGSAGRLISATVVATTGTVVNANVGGGIGHKFLADTDLFLTVGGGTLATGAIINTVIEYVTG